MTSPEPQQANSIPSETIPLLSLPRADVPAAVPPFGFTQVHMDRYRLTDRIAREIT